MQNSGCESVIELQQHLFYQPRTCLCPQHLKWTTSLETTLWLAQPTRRLRVLAEDFFGQGSDASDPYGTVGFIVGQRLTTSPPMHKGSPWNDEAVDFVIAHPVMRKRFHGGEWQAFINQASKITV